jgi:hypothetical protein
MSFYIQKRFVSTTYIIINMSYGASMVMNFLALICGMNLKFILGHERASEHLFNFSEYIENVFIRLLAIPGHALL